LAYGDVVIGEPLAYGDVVIGEPLALIGSHDFLDVSVNQGNASERFGVRGGDTVAVLRTTCL